MEYRFVALVVAAVAAAAGSAASALPRARATCGLGTYAYAGVRTGAPVGGVRATIVPVAAPEVRSGHVDAWVGVGGPGLGPGGADEWIQVGVTAGAGDRAQRVYVEIVRPGRADVFHELRREVGVGERHRFAIREVAGRPGWWRAWVDDSPVLSAVFLGASHGRWRAHALAESWTGMSSGSCNRYAYAFSGVAVASVGGGSWSAVGRETVLSDPPYRMQPRGTAGFVVSVR